MKITIDICRYDVNIRALEGAAHRPPDKALGPSDLCGLKHKTVNLPLPVISVVKYYGKIHIDSLGTFFLNITWNDK